MLKLLNPCLSILFIFVLLPHCVQPSDPAADVSPSPMLGPIADDYSYIGTPPSPPPVTESPAPSPAKYFTSFGAPYVSDLPPVPSPANHAGYEADDIPTPSSPPPYSPELSAEDDDGEFSHNGHGNEEPKKVNSGGSGGGRAAGIVVGLLASVCIVGLGGFVYKKRQENLRRARYRFSDDNDWL